MYSDRSKVFPSQELLVAGAWRRLQGQEKCIVITRIFSKPHVGCELNTVGLLQSEIMSYFLKIFGRFFFKTIFPVTFEDTFIAGAHKKLWPCYAAKLQMWRGIFSCCFQNIFLFLFDGYHCLCLKKRMHNHAIFTFTMPLGIWWFFTVTSSKSKDLGLYLGCY